MTTNLIVERQWPNGQWTYDATVRSMAGARLRVAETFALTNAMRARVRENGIVVVDAERPMRPAQSRKVA